MIYDGPARGGTRGGRDQFKWSDVAVDKDRTHYLGHSIKAPRTHGKSSDVYWYMNDKKDDEKAALAEERRLFKEKEKKLQMEALGLPYIPSSSSSKDKSKSKDRKRERENDPEKEERRKLKKDLKRKLKEEKKSKKKSKKKHKTKHEE